MSVKALLEKRANVWEQAKALIDRAEAENRDFTAEEKEQYDKMMAEMDELAKRAQRLEEAERLEKELQARANEPIKAGVPGATPEKDKREAVRAAFRTYLQTGVVLPELRDLAAGVDASGGYLVAPEEFVAEVIKDIDNVTFVRRIANVIPLKTSDSLGVPTLDTDMSDPDWTAEVGAISADTSMAFGKRSLTPQLLTKLVKVSMKLLRVSAVPAEQFVRQRLAYKFGAALENNFLNGDGSGKPLGVFVADANGITTNRDVTDGNTTTAISADSIIAAKYALKEGYRRNAKWIFHRDVLKEIAKLKDSDGQYLWRPGLTAGQPDTLSGLPVFESEYAPNALSAGAYVGILGDFSYYWIAELQALEIQRLNELYAANSQVGFIGRLWADGQPVLENAFARIQLAV
jgi:HK97 family phage major capsid protein